MDKEIFWGKKLILTFTIVSLLSFSIGFFKGTTAWIPWNQNAATTFNLVNLILNLIGHYLFSIFILGINKAFNIYSKTTLKMTNTYNKKKHKKKNKKDQKS